MELNFARPGVEEWDTGNIFSTSWIWFVLALCEHIGHADIFIDIGTCANVERILEQICMIYALWYDAHPVHASTISAGIFFQ